MQYPTPVLADFKFEDSSKTSLEKVINLGMFIWHRQLTRLSKHSDWPALTANEQVEFPRETIPFYTLEETINFWTFVLLLESIISHFLVLTSDLCLGFRLQTGATSHTGGRAGAKSQF